MGNAPVKTAEASTDGTHRTDTQANPHQGLPIDKGTEMVEARATIGRGMTTMRITGEEEEEVTRRTKAEETVGVEDDSRELQGNLITVSCAVHTR